MEAPLVTHPASDKLLGWTPDGQHVFFTSDRNGTWDGWLLRVEDGKPRGLPEVIKAGMGDVSPIGFTRSGSFYYNFRHEAWNVYTAKLDLDTGEALSAPSPVRHVGKDVRPDWSPDGRYLAYCSERDRNKTQVVRIRTLATGQERELKTELPHFDWLRWCPDSRHLLITNFNRGSPSVVYKLDVQTGEHTALVQSDEPRIRQAELSADGKTLAYRIRGLGNANRLIVRDMETGREKELLRSESMGAAALLFWALSPDGKHVALSVVALSVGEDGMNRAFVLKIISVASGEARTVVGDSVGELAWINDGRDLLFAKGFKELWRVSAEGGEPRKLWEWKQMLWGLRIHPDGQRIAFFSGGNMSEMWVMENFLPTGVSQAK
jgi:Tol biopolymer transport system component